MENSGEELERQLENKIDPKEQYRDPNARPGFRLAGFMDSPGFIPGSCHCFM